jgi:hypothetical protein
MTTPRVTRNGASGAALVMVLSVSVMVAVVAVLFLTLGRGERVVAVVEREGGEARRLADMAVSLAIGQVRQATMGGGGEVTGWASQPGAIRTWGEGGQGGVLFKLYSSSESMASLEGEAERAGWLERERLRYREWNAKGAGSARYVDLNEPLVIRDWAGEVEEVMFPIADPRAMVVDKVEGFGVREDGVAGTVIGGGVEARLPMPVEWLYVLEDGTLGVLDEGNRFVASGGGGSRASEENRIVGRVAYWTDDEGCKVNVNTASEGIPWDTPRCVSRKDVAYGEKQPVRNEVQRWPGHPATVCLSSIFYPGRTLDPMADFERLRALYDLAPRVHWGNAEGQRAGVFGEGTGGIELDEDGLYASLDDVLYAGDGTLNAVFGIGREGREKLERNRFFLTVNSRAPETTASGHPRVSLWPVNANHGEKSSLVTAYDRAMHFTCTLGGEDGREYHVQRRNPASQVDEYHLLPPLRRNSELAGYLERQLRRGLPKYGGSFFDKYPERDVWFNVYRSLDFIRSTNLHDSSFLRPERRVTPYQETKIPGIVAGCALSEIVGKEGVPEWVKAIENYRIPGRDYTLSEVALVLICVAHHREDGVKVGPVAFFREGDPAALRRGEKAVQAAILFEGFCTEQGYAMVLPHLRVFLESGTLANLRINGKELEHQGHSHTHGQLFEAWGSPPFTYGNTRPKGPNRGDGTRRPDNWVGWGGSGGFHVFTSPVVVRDGVEQVKKPGERTGYYTTEFFRVRDDEPMTLTSAPEGGGAEASELRLDVTMERTWVTSWDARQRLRFEFPLPLRVPVPEIDAETPDMWSWDQRMRGRAHRVLTERYQGELAYDRLLQAGDVIRSLVVAHGDYRLPDVWGRKERRFNDRNVSVTEDYFAPHPGYEDASRRQAHSLVPSGGERTYYQTGEGEMAGYAKGVRYAPEVTPDFPIAAEAPKGGRDDYGKGVLKTYLEAYGREMIDPGVTRDWSNGTGIVPDGAYSGKADDGSRMRGGVDGPPFEGDLPPYFNKKWEDTRAELDGGEESGAPNRLVNSAGMFGSLPSMPTSNVPWTTFLFRPDLSGGHVGSKWNGHDRRRYFGRLGQPRPSGLLPPPDHLLMDLFWMPVIAPYGISDRFSTAGKVNVNHQMVPFVWIERKTALHAALKAEEVLAIPTGAGARYKDVKQIETAPEWRHRIDAEATLKQWDEMFERGDAFVSPSEICEGFLVPEGRASKGMKGEEIEELMRAFWAEHALTGDNTMERPYSNLQAKLTARSNVFRVHFRAQAIRKSRSSEASQFDPEKDRVVGEYRGDTVFERHLPPERPVTADAASRYPDYVREAAAASLDRYYHYRVIEHRRFSR